MAKCARKGCVENGTRRVQVPGPGKQTVDVCWTHARELEDMMAKKCAVSVCDGQGSSKGCCPKHYQRFLKLKLLEGLETVTPAQADDFQRRWEAERDANPRMAAGSKGGGSGKTHAVSLPKPTPAPTAPPEPVREVVVPAISATHKSKAPVPAKAPPKPLPAPVYPDVRAMDDALLDAARRERDKLSEKAIGLAGEVERLKREYAVALDEREALRADLDGARVERDVIRARADDLKAKATRQEEEIARLTRETLNQRHEHARERDRWEGATAPSLVQTRLTALLRESEPLRLAFVDALHHRAIQTLRRAAQDPNYADTLAADLLALDVPVVG